jgi:hypothetical protein
VEGEVVNETCVLHERAIPAPEMDAFDYARLYRTLLLMPAECNRTVAKPLGTLALFHYAEYLTVPTLTNLSKAIWSTD